MTKILGNSSNIEYFMMDGYLDSRGINHKERIKHLLFHLNKQMAEKDSLSRI